PSCPGKITVPAHIQIKDGNDHGVIFANGGLNRGGSSLYLKDNRLYYTITDGVEEHTFPAERLLFAGKHTIRLEFIDDSLSITINQEREPPIKLPLARRSFLASAGGDGISLGHDYGVPVTKQYLSPYPFTHIIDKLIVQQDTP